MKQNILDSINALHHTSCIQPVHHNNMITLSQLKSRSFLASTSSRYFQVHEVEQQKPKKKMKEISSIHYKFELEDEICHKVLKQVLQSSKTRNPLLPLHRQHQPNPQTKGLSIGRIEENKSTQQVSIEEVHSKTSRFNKILKRNSSQPLLDESKHLSFYKNHGSSKDIQEKSTERSRQKRIHLGSTFQVTQTESKIFEIDCGGKNRDSSVKRRLSQKQFNLYKNRKLAGSNIACKFKQMKEEELQERIKSKRANDEKSIFDSL